MAKLSYLLLMVVVSVVVRQSHAATNPADAFRDALMQYTSSIFGTPQATVDSMASQFTKTTPSGNDMVSKMANAINTRATAYVTALRNTRDEIVRSYSTSMTTIATTCCNVATGQRDAAYNFTVDTNMFCMEGVGGTPSTTVGSNILGVMQANLASIPTMKWQYYGREDRVSLTYPAPQRCDTTYDPVLRPWYTSTLVNSRDIVIAIDKSAGMGATYGGPTPAGQTITYLQAALAAASKFLDSLTQRDRINIIDFAGDPINPTTKCMSTRLEVATSITKFNLRSYLSSVTLSTTASSKPAYDQALNAAFRLMNASRLDDTGYPIAQRVRMILLVTAGGTTSSSTNVYASVVNGNKINNNQISIMTYGMGRLSATDMMILQSIALQKNLTGMKAPFPVAGTFTALSSTDDISVVMSSYYRLFINPNPNPSSVNVILPYIDASGLGTVSTICLPVFYNNALKGVTCIDIPLDELFAEAVVFKYGMASYAFAIAIRGSVVIHPFIPLPHTSVNEVTYLKVDDVEINPSMSKVKSSMVAGLGDSLTNQPFTIMRPRGDQTEQGVDAIPTKASFYWAPVASINYSVCIVIVSGDEQSSTLGWTNPYNDFLWDNQIDITSKSMCSHWGRVADFSRTSIDLAPKCYANPAAFTDLFLNASTLDIMKADLLNSGSPPLAGLTVMPGVREAIQATAFLEPFWLKLPHSVFNNIKWAYIGTVQGVWRLYPALKFPATYDPTSRPWFVRASVLDPGQLSVRLPVIDAFDGTPLVTLSQPIFAGSASHGPGDRLFAVAGVDMKLSYFKTIFQGSFGQCQSADVSCFVITDNGYVVLHDTFLNNPSFIRAMVHITQLEPAIAWQMVNDGLLMSDTCIDYTMAANHTFWKLNIPAGVYDKPAYTVFNVTNINVNIVLKKNAAISGMCSCNTTYLLPDGSQRCSYGSPVCECVCADKTDIYDICLNRITKLIGLKGCRPSLARINALALDLTAETAQIPLISDCLCDLYTNNSACTMHNCCWKDNMCGPKMPGPDGSRACPDVGGITCTQTLNLLNQLSAKVDAIMSHLGISCSAPGSCGGGIPPPSALPNTPAPDGSGSGKG